MAVRPHHQGDVRIDRTAQAQDVLQEQLLRRTRKQVGAAHDAVDALRRIIDDNRKLVCKGPVAPSNDEIPAIPVEKLFAGTLETITEGIEIVGNADPERGLPARRGRSPFLLLQLPMGKQSARTGRDGFFSRMGR